MGDQHAHAQRRQALQGHQGLEHAAGVAFVPAGQERGQRIDHEQVKAMLGVQLGDPVQKVQPLIGRRPAEERPAEPADVVAEGQLLAAQIPMRRPFFGEDHGLAGSDGQAGQLAARLHLVEQHGDQRRLARFPLAGQQGDVAGGQIAVPQPAHLPVGRLHP